MSNRRFVKLQQQKTPIGGGNQFFNNNSMLISSILSISRRDSNSGVRKLFVLFLFFNSPISLTTFCKHELKEVCDSVEKLRRNIYTDDINLIQCRLQSKTIQSQKSMKFQIFTFTPTTVFSQGKGVWSTQDIAADNLNICDALRLSQERKNISADILKSVINSVNPLIQRRYNLSNYICSTI